MKTSRIDQMLQTQRLVLTKRQAFTYYIGSIIFSVFAFVMLLTLIENISNQTKHYGFFFSIFLTLLFTAVTLVNYCTRRRSLRLKELQTPFSKQENYQIAKAALQSLHWMIQEDDIVFIEAFAQSGRPAFSDQLFSVLITDQKILFNSIESLDGYGSRGIRWGRNKKNRKLFVQAFKEKSLIAHKAG